MSLHTHLLGGGGGGGGWVSGFARIIKTQSPKSLANLYFLGGGGILENWYSWQNEPKIVEA